MVARKRVHQPVLYAHDAQSTKWRLAASNILKSAYVSSIHPFISRIFQLSTRGQLHCYRASGARPRAEGHREVPLHGHDRRRKCCSGCVLQAHTETKARLFPHTSLFKPPSSHFSLSTNPIVILSLPSPISTDGTRRGGPRTRLHSYHPQPLFRATLPRWTPGRHPAHQAIWTPTPIQRAHKHRSAVGYGGSLGRDFDLSWIYPPAASSHLERILTF
jgi:hypothetical protein